MSWRWCCLLVAAVTMRQTHAAPLIADPTFSDIDLLAEDTQASEVYVAAPIRTKRTPQFFGNNCAFSGGCGGWNIFESINTPAYYNYANSPQHSAYNNALMYIKDAIYAQQQQQQLATVVNHEHQRNGALPPSSTTSGAYNQQSFDSYSPQSFHAYKHSHYALQDCEQAPTPPQPPPASLHTPSDYYDYDTNDYSSGYHNYPAPGFHGYNPFGFHPRSPFGVPPGFNRGRPHFGSHAGWTAGFGGRREPPGFNREPSPAAPTPTNAPLPTQQTFAPIPNTTPQPVMVTVASTTSSATTSTTPEPTYDIDIRFGN